MYIYIYILVFLSDEGPMLETLDHTIRIGSTPTFLYFDLYLYSAYAAHYVYIYIYIHYVKILSSPSKIARCLLYTRAVGISASWVWRKLLYRNSVLCRLWSNADVTLECSGRDWKKKVRTFEWTAGRWNVRKYYYLKHGLLKSEGENLKIKATELRAWWLTL